MISTDTHNALTGELGRLKAERARLDAEIATLTDCLQILSGRPAQAPAAVEVTTPGPGHTMAIKSPSAAPPRSPVRPERDARVRVRAKSLHARIPAVFRSPAEELSTTEIAERLKLTGQQASNALHEAVRCGLALKVRRNCYRLGAKR